MQFPTFSATTDSPGHLSTLFSTLAMSGMVYLCGSTMKYPICSRTILRMMLEKPGASRALATPPKSKSMSGGVRKYT